MIICYESSIQWWLIIWRSIDIDDISSDVAISTSEFYPKRIRLILAQMDVNEDFVVSRQKKRRQNPEAPRPPRKRQALHFFFYKQPLISNSASACLAGTWFSASSVLSGVLKEIYCTIYILYYIYIVLYNTYILLYYMYCTLYCIIVFYIYLWYYNNNEG